ncbi:MAG TPA: ABC transporter ATP-binding protein [Alphaproteobacteria bacterium]|nr:ABC transporter ATP-binding protein [Alphaproteobacteria bacterium]
MTARLELIDIHKRFEDTAAVNGISLALAPGEFFSLLGPSGCGKSTTLAMVAGFLEPDGGEIRVEGRSILHLPPQARRIGLVFQDYAVFSKLTVAENLAFGLEVRRVRRAERRRLVHELAQRLALTSILGRRGGSLNMSEMQRVALARVLITNPELLLLDEPMSNLDAEVRASLRGELKRIQQDLRQTVLYVTHDQVEAMSMSDRIAVMREGAILQVASPDEIFRAPAHRFVAEFIGDPPINMLPATVEGDGSSRIARLPANWILPLGPGELAEGAYLLGIRPHELMLSAASGTGTAAGIVRFLENLGAEHVLHVELGDMLIRVSARPGSARIGEGVNLRTQSWQGLLFDARTGNRVPVRALGAAA